MGKLMKYEWKKQRTSRMIVMVALAVCVLTFLGGMLVEKDALMGISATLLLVGSYFVVFYMGIESILILNRDLKTKQSYMIWMTPKSVWEILGAKFVVAIAQMFFVFALYAIVGLLCFVGTIQYVGELGNVFAIIRDSFIRVSGEGQLIAQIIWNLLCIFVGWTEVVMVGYLAVIVSRTILRDSKYAGGISIVAFFVITFIIEKIYNLISNVLPNVEVAGNSFFGGSDPFCHLFRRNAAGNHVRGVRPVGAGALVEQLVQLFPGAALDDRAVGVALDASIAGVKGLVQQYYCAVFPGVVCAVRVQHCAAAAGDHSILCAERPDRLSLFLPEIRFAVLGENVRDGLAFLFYDISVCVDQRQPQLFRQDLAHCGLAAAHKAAKKNRHAVPHFLAFCSSISSSMSQMMDSICASL